MSAPFADLTLAAFAEALAGDSPTPGSGAAAAVALALAAGCLAKAAAITLKQGHDEELATLAELARNLARSALTGADQESRAFRELLRDPADGVDESVRVGDGLLTLAEGLRALRPRLEPRIKPAVSGDLAAAEALLEAAERILLANNAEAALAQPAAGG